MPDVLLPRIFRVFDVTVSSDELEPAREQDRDHITPYWRHNVHPLLLLRVTIELSGYGFKKERLDCQAINRPYNDQDVSGSVLGLARTALYGIGISQVPDALSRLVENVHLSIMPQHFER